jgi:outer membrane protein assembly factor BamB
MNIRKRAVAPLLLLITVVFSLADCRSDVAKNNGFDWPQRRGPDNNGISRETGWNPRALAGDVRVLWTTKVGSGYSDVAVKDGRVYTAGTVEGALVVWCLRDDSGGVIWQYRVQDVLESQSTPTVGDNSVYILSKEGILLCFDRKKGRLRWRKDIVSTYGAVPPIHGYAGSPVLVGKLVLLNANTAGMALDQKTGALVWTSEKPPAKVRSYREASTGTDYSTPVVYDEGGKQYALCTSYKGVSSVAVETGELYWLYEWELYAGFQVPDPVIIGDKVFIASDLTSIGDAACSLLQIQNGKPVIQWKSRELNSDISSPVILDGFVYCCHGGPDYSTAYLRCLDLVTGQMKWEEHLSSGTGFDSISLISADGKLIILNEKGTLSIAEANPEAYKEISRADVLVGRKMIRRFWMPPVLSGGRIYCRNLPGELICVDVRR